MVKTLSIGDGLDYETLELMDAREYGDLQTSLESQSMVLHDEGDGRVVAWMYDTQGHRIDPVVSPEQPDCECE
jgi:hypothetical protein